jgi:methionine aminopeptidase
MDSNARIAEDIEKTSQYISCQDIEKSIAAGKLAHQVLDEILAFIRPGIKESEVKNYAFSRYEFHALQRPWHMPYIRFGQHTLLTYRDKPKEDRTLGENDIAFADIGIVKDDIEGDAGRTVVFGANEIFNKLADASQTIFAKAAAYWRQQDPQGTHLYTAIEQMTQQVGLAFNLDTAGHLIGTFPHKGWKQGLNHFPDKAKKGAWVLEIQIRHPELPYGAFFEDLLI